MLHPGESRYADGTDRHTDRWTDGGTPDRYVTLSAMDAASVHVTMEETQLSQIDRTTLCVTSFMCALRAIKILRRPNRVCITCNGRKSRIIVNRSEFELGDKGPYTEVPWLRGTVVERRSVTGELYWSKIADLNLPHHLYLVPRLGWSRWNFAEIFRFGKLESMDYRTALFVWSYIKPFWYNTRVWQTDARRDKQINT